MGFESLASNLVPADTNGTTDAFVHDMGSGHTTRVSERTPFDAVRGLPPVTPDRLLDTAARGRAGRPGETITIASPDVGDVPADAAAVALNVTVTELDRSAGSHRLPDRFDPCRRRRP